MAVPRTTQAVPWRRATQGALYGAGGFYVSGAAPADHFRTSATASPLLAGAVGTLLVEVDAALGHPTSLDLVDVGAGRAELLVGVLAALPEGHHDLRSRVRPLAVEQAPRPPGVPGRVAWSAAPPPRVVGLLLAHELLDDVPVDVVQLDRDGEPRLVLVDPTTGEESLGGPPSPTDRAWLDRWWPVAGGPPGLRAEVGVGRDADWADLVGRLGHGLAVAVDYGHTRTARRDGRFAGGTLTGYLAGRQVRPVPDGRCDVTAHVALDSCAAAGAAAGAAETVLTTQRAALLALGLLGSPPDPALASCDPATYVHRLQRAGEAAELLDPGGLGGFGWLVQSVGAPLPSRLVGLPAFVG